MRLAPLEVSMMSKANSKSLSQPNAAISKKFDDFYRRFDRHGKNSPGGEKHDGNDFEFESMPVRKRSFQAEFGGLAIVAPYFPVLFRNLDLLDEASCIKKDKYSQAATLLHYLATGAPPNQLSDVQYFALLLGFDECVNDVYSDKMLAEFSEADRLLKSIMANWPVSKNLGMSGLRDGFLKRPAKVTEYSANYKLQLQAHPLDVILRSIPWSISVSFHPWMKKPLMVEWLS